MAVCKMGRTSFNYLKRPQSLPKALSSNGCNVVVQKFVESNWSGN